MKRRLSALFAAVVVSLACLVPSQAHADDGDVTVSGTVGPISALSQNPQVAVCVRDSGKSVWSCFPATVDTVTGEYSVMVKPGQHETDTYTVRALADGYFVTWLGGAASSITDPLPADVTTFSLAGGSVTGKDVTLVKASTISGTLSPAAAAKANAKVYACPVVTDQSGPSDYSYISSSCTQGRVDAATGTYQIGTGGLNFPPLNNGATYAVYATAGGYQKTWLGNVANLQTPQASDVTTVTTAVAGGDTGN